MFGVPPISPLFPYTTLFRSEINKSFRREPGVTAPPDPPCRTGNKHLAAGKVVQMCHRNIQDPADVTGENHRPVMRQKQPQDMFPIKLALPPGKIVRNRPR